MDKNGENFELETLLNEKEDKQISDKGKQKKSPLNGKRFLKVSLQLVFVQCLERCRSYNG